MKKSVRKSFGAASLSLILAVSVTCAPFSGCAYASNTLITSAAQQNTDEQAQTQVSTKAIAGDDAVANATKAVAKPKIKKMYSKRFIHGKKTTKQTKYIVLHDTEVSGVDASAIAKSWKNSNNGYVAAHFVVGRDGAIVQCVPLNKIAHHAGFGNKGHNKKFKVSSKRDDMRGVKSIGSAYPDYGMNACSIGIEICHASGESYTKAQLKSLDKLIAYIDYKLGKKCRIIDHKTWRTTNSDTSAAFAKHLKNYKSKRHH